MSNARDIADAGHQLVAWVNFDGTNAFSPNPSTSAIRASFNVSSIFSYGTGQYGINFTPDMPDTNYVIIAMTGDNRIIGSGLNGTSTVSQARVSTQAGGAFSNEDVFLAIFR